MQATTVNPTPPPTPVAPAPAVAGTPTVTYTGTDGTTQVLPVPLTEQALRDLKSQRDQLSSQLTNVASRRRRVSEELSKTADPAARVGLEQRLGVLDKRIAQMELDLATTGRQLAAAPTELTSSTGDPMRGGDMPQNVTAIVGIFTIFVLGPLAIAMARFIWRRASKVPAQAVALSPQIDQRLERLEQGVDAIAIEIERITEGQRFVTKLLAEQDSREKLPAP